MSDEYTEWISEFKPRLLILAFAELEMCGLN